MATTSLICFILASVASVAQCGKMFTPLNKNYKVACLAEHLKDHANYVCDPYGYIVCMPGWTDEEHYCTTPICEFNGLTCDRGNCTAPHMCECELGWYGQVCDKCLTLPKCKNGYCVEAFECICEPGWEGQFCDKPLCDNCVHGHCSSPGVCTCHPGWSGANCTHCLEDPDCVHGRCVDKAFQCKCYDGFTGHFCDTPECSQGCHPDHGMCFKPNECWCRPGWQGPTCSRCVPYWNCVHGHCEKPFECICDPGYTGKDCNSTSDQNGNWGSWGSWGTCSVTCGANGVETRTRQCNDPAPSGDGLYCSHDGSSSFQTRPCSGLPNCTIQAPQWGQWSAYGACTTTCGPGVQRRTRTCSSGNPQDCGPGPALETRNCTNNALCPNDGNWSQWTPFSPCTAICVGDVGERVRRRTCSDPPPSNGGAACAGNERESIQCFGTTPRQTANPNLVCFAIGGK